MSESTTADEKKIKHNKRIKQIADNNNFKIIKVLGEGGFGEVFEIEYEGKKYALKVMLNENNRELNIEMVDEFRGKQIVKIIKQGKYGGGVDFFYVMEDSFIGVLSHFREYLNNNLIFEDAFEEKFGDNLIRFFTKQLVIGLQTFYQGNLVHFDIKPNNLLIYDF